MSLGVGGILDDAAAMAAFDRSDMLGAIASLPGQLVDAWGRTRELRMPGERPRAVCLLGMGGSAIAGDLARGIWSDRLTVPLEVVRGYDLPRWVDGQTLVVASSYSGATEETISALGMALERRCPVAVITTGGPIRGVAERAGLPLVTFPSGGQPRAAIGYALGSLGGLLERAGVLDLGEEEIRAAASTSETMVVSSGPAVSTDRNLAKQLAWTLVDRLPVIEASGALAPVARRWKTQLNENGKSMAVFEELPEATHNTVVGYQQPESVRDHLFVVFLASALDHPRNALRASLSGMLLSGAQIGYQVVPVPGEGRLAQALAAICLGDHVSAYLAFTYGLDPTPVEAIGVIKHRLSATDEEEPE